MISIAVAMAAAAFVCLLIEGKSRFIGGGKSISVIKVEICIWLSSRPSSFNALEWTVASIFGSQLAVHAHVQTQEEELRKWIPGINRISLRNAARFHSTSLKTIAENRSVLAFLSMNTQISKQQAFQAPKIVNSFWLWSVDGWQASKQARQAEVISKERGRRK